MLDKYCPVKFFPKLSLADDTANEDLDVAYLFSEDVMRRVCLFIAKYMRAPHELSLWHGL